ncbi:MAG: ester cyclase [Bacteroidota bacterium]
MTPHTSFRTALVLLVALSFAGCVKPDPSVALKPLVDRYVLAWNTGDVKGLEEIVSSDFQLRMTPGFEPTRGIDSLKSAIAYWRTAYPDFTITLDEVIYTQSVIAARWTIKATNSGPGSSPPTGKTVVVPGMSLLHVAEGKLVDEWIAGNDLSWMQQLGYSFAPPQAGK